MNADHTDQADTIRAYITNIGQRVGMQETLAALDALAARAAAADNLADALREAAERAQEILDVLESGKEPYASSGYGYEHMGDYTRDVRPLCDLLIQAVAAYTAAPTLTEPGDVKGSRRAGGSVGAGTQREPVLPPGSVSVDAAEENA